MKPLGTYERPGYRISTDSASLATELIRRMSHEDGALFLIVLGLYPSDVSTSLHAIQSAFERGELEDMRELFCWYIDKANGLFVRNRGQLRIFAAGSGHLF